MNKLLFLIKLSGRFVRLFVSGKFVRLDDIRQSYEDVSSSYNQLFLTRMGKHSIGLLQKLEINNCSKILDLGCGTGFSIQYFKSKYPKCQITAIDFSSKMIASAKRLVNREKFSNIRFLYGDMLKKAEKLPANSYDVVICLWALGYTKPKRLLREAYRVLKANGRIGIIVNSKRSLPEVRKLFWQTLFQYPQKMKKIIIEPPWPKNKEHLAKLLALSGFKNIEKWQGEERFSFEKGEDATCWIFGTGALAGYDQILDIKNDAELFKYFTDNWKTASSENIVITHKFVAVIAKK